MVDSSSTTRIFPLITQSRAFRLAIPGLRAAWPRLDLHECTGPLVETATAPAPSPSRSHTFPFSGALYEDTTMLAPPHPAPAALRPPHEPYGRITASETPRRYAHHVRASH